MKKLFSVVIVALFAANMAYAAGTPSCADKAAEKKLAGAAKNAFMTKCEKDVAAAAAPSCEIQAAEKKLAGAAKNSFMKKCIEAGAGK